MCSDTEYLAIRTLFRRTREVSAADITAELARLEAQVREQLAADGVRPEEMTIVHTADLRYAGQAYELTVPARPDLAGMAADFDAEHVRTYGHASPGAPTDIVSLKVIGRAPAAEDAGLFSRLATPAAEPSASRDAYFGATFGKLRTPVIARRDLSAAAQPGPLIVEEYDATCVVPPDATAALDADGNIDIRIGAS
jgi:N-methylhydantoinase A